MPILTIATYDYAKFSATWIWKWPIHTAKLSVWGHWGKNELLEKIKGTGPWNKNIFGRTVSWNETKQNKSLWDFPLR